MTTETAMREIIKFIGFVHGPWVTVRVGGKWGGVEPGEVLLASQCEAGHDGDCSPALGCTPGGAVMVSEVWRGPLRDIPARLLELEHAPQCRTLAGLGQVLDRIYGEVTGNTLVVALLLQPLHE